MARSIYANKDGASGKLKKLYTNVDGKSRKVKKVYANVDGKSRLCYIGETKWNRYSIDYTYSWSRYKKITTYTWNQYDVTKEPISDTSFMISTGGSYTHGMLGMGYAGDDQYQLTIQLYSSYTVSDGKFVGYGSLKSYTYDSKYGGNINGYLIVDSGNHMIRVAGGGATSYQGSMYYGVSSSNCYSIGDVVSSLNGQVTSTDRNAYPTNGVSGSYHYEYQSSVDSRGDYIADITSKSSSAYPSNGVSGSYWYVKGPTTSGCGNLIDSVTSDNPNAYPDDGISGSYYYKKVDG